MPFHIDTDSIAAELRCRLHTLLDSIRSEQDYSGLSLDKQAIVDVVVTFSEDWREYSDGEKK